MSRRVMAALVLAILAASGLILYHATSEGKVECKGFKIVEFCAMTDRVIVRFEGNCNEVLVRFYDSSGTLKGSTSVKPGELTLNRLDTSIPPGEYTVKVYDSASGSLIDSFKANVSLAPYPVKAAAIAWFNGTITINFNAVYPQCATAYGPKGYGVSLVIVHLNGTSRNYPGFWTVGKPFSIDTGETITPDTVVEVELVDVLGYSFQVPVLQPR